MTAQRKNSPRPIEAIEAEIYTVERKSTLQLGKLFREAKAQLEHGKWLPWVDKMRWNRRTAQTYMAVADLADKYESVAHLDAAPSALYELVRFAEEHPGLVKLAIKQLKQSIECGDDATEQCEVILRTPNAKLNPGLHEVALRGVHEAINVSCFGDVKRSEAMGQQAKAIAKANPKTEEELAKIEKANPIPLPAGMKFEPGDEPDDDKDKDNTEPAQEFEADGEPIVMPPRPEHLRDVKENGYLSHNWFTHEAITVLRHVDPSTVSLKGLDPAEVAEARDKLDTILNRLRGGNAVKLIADRAEARSRQNAATEGQS